jgi:hypothetical protein
MWAVRTEVSTSVPRCTGKRIRIYSNYSNIIIPHMTGEFSDCRSINPVLEKKIFLKKEYIFFRDPL